MTRPSQKKRERFFAEQAARLLGENWSFGTDDHEHPDFIVTESEQQFGLEITQIFVGAQGDSGSTLKAKESNTQRMVNALQREYESITNIPLVVKFVGNMETANLVTVVPALVAQDFRSMPIGYHFVHDTSIAFPARAPLRVHVTKGLRADWYSVNDRAGFVHRNPYDVIVDAIAKKANELARYKEAAGSDVRLLLVADCISNSGKLILGDRLKFDFHGFKSVYLFLYPEGVIVLENASDS